MSNLTQSFVDAHNARVDAGRKKDSSPLLDGRPIEDSKESDLHRKIEEELKRRRFYYVHSMTHKRTTQQAGVPDFIVAMPDGKSLWIECKTGKNKLSKEQTITRHILLALGHRFCLVTSLKQFMEVMG